MSTEFNYLKLYNDDFEQFYLVFNDEEGEITETSYHAIRVFLERFEKALNAEIHSVIYSDSSNKLYGPENFQNYIINNPNVIDLNKIERGIR
ncbi:MAG: hypothetical protein LBV67_09025 [Streptococcaceae bacterium]|jgi:hypothetical protein|nr:hypothetical protein [Streptococcaceae bacterium]